MKIISWPRAQGKTDHSIRWLLADPENRVLITATHDDASRTRERARAMFLETLPEDPVTGQAIELMMRMVKIYSYQDWQRPGRRTRKSDGGPLEICIDDLDMILGMQVGNVQVATMREKVEVVPSPFLGA